MKQERFQTTIHFFDDKWVDSDGLIGPAYSWAQENIAPGHRVIGQRSLSFNGELGIYKFDFRNSREFGLQLEAEIPARCRTVIRVNRRQMTVVEVDSGTLVSKHLRFIDKNGNTVWRAWMRRIYDYHIEETLPGQNLMIFMLQCNKTVRDVSKFINADWLSDLRERMYLPYNSDTPEALLPFLGELQKRVDAWLDVYNKDITATPPVAECRKFYTELVKWGYQTLSSMKWNPIQR